MKLFSLLVFLALFRGTAWAGETEEVDVECDSWGAIVCDWDGHRELQMHQNGSTPSTDGPSIERELQVVERMLTFEGVGDLVPVLDFYNAAMGITFINARGLVDQDAGGSGNTAFEPSGETTMIPTFSSMIMNVAVGFGSPFTVSYARPFDVGGPYSYTVYTDEYGLGTPLVGGSLLVNGQTEGDPNGNYSAWTTISAPFAGVARSVVLSGNSYNGAYDYIVYDNIGLGPMNDDCTDCRDWYLRNDDTAWITALPQCPCQADFTPSVHRRWKWWPLPPGFVDVEECDVRPEGSNNAGELGDHDWDKDRACNGCGGWLDDCDEYHPGAFACIRTDGPGDTGQQCCYDGDGISLPHGHPGAGTPDISTSLLRHIREDVNPYESCCDNCPDLCDLYIGDEYKQGARGDNRGCE